MNCWKRFVLIGVLGVTLALTALSSTGEATWLRNWLARRNAAQTNYYGGGTRGGLFRGGLLSRFHHRQPTVAYYAAPAPVACGQSCQTTCQRQVVQYVPRTAYRTVWNRIPTTVYRPVTSVDPCTSCQTVCYRPCTTYQYQSQQVPYTAYQPVVRTVTYQVPSSCPQTFAAANPCCATAGAVAAPNPGCSSCNQTSPGWVPSAGQAPSMIVPSPRVDPSFAPNGGFDPSIPNQPTPADDAADEVPVLTPRSSFSPPAFEQQLQGSGYRPSFNTASPAAATQPPVSIPALRPLPNLDDDSFDSAPDLVSPRQRTAAKPMIRLVGAVSEIDWAKPRSDQTTKVSRPQAASVETKWDDSGWRSAK